MASSLQFEVDRKLRPRLIPTWMIFCLGFKVQGFYLLSLIIPKIQPIMREKAHNFPLYYGLQIFRMPMQKMLKCPVSRTEVFIGPLLDFHARLGGGRGVKDVVALRV